MDNQPRERFFGLTPAQVGGSVLAATTGAFVASWSGAAGTVIGTALTSAVATIGAAAYTASFRRTGHAVRRTAAQVRPGARATFDPVSTAAITPTPDPATETARGAAPTRAVRRIELPWGRLALASTAITLAVLGGITGLELVTGQPVTTYAGGSSTGTTTLGGVLSKDTTTTSTTADDAGDPATVDPEPTATPTESGTAEPTPSTPVTPTPTPTPTEPAAEETPSSVPTPSPSASADPTPEG